MADLKPKQSKVLEALMVTGDVSKASEMAGVSRKTVYNYLKQTTFIKAYREARGDAIREATAKLSKASGQAVDVLTEIMLDDSVSPYARQQAAQSVLNFAYKAFENESIIEVVEELKIEMERLEMEK